MAGIASLTVGFGWPVGLAEACSVCLAGDPLYSSQGSTAQQEGSVSVFLEARGWEKESGVLPFEDVEGEEEEEEAGHRGDEDASEDNESQRLDLYLSWTPLDRFTVTINVPWSFNAITEREDGENVASTLSGVGDISLQTSHVLWRNRDVLPSSWFEGRTFVKFPTGKSKQRIDGRRDPHLQLGTGSFDLGLGLAAVHKLEWGVLYGSTSYRWNTEGSLNYEYGDVFLANAAVEVPLGHVTEIECLEPFSPGLELNFRHAGHDDVEDTRFDESGGQILYTTPSLRIRLPWFRDGNAPMLRVAGQIPTTSSWLNGFQHADPIWSVGLGYTF